MAIPVPNIIALPIPCRIRKEINKTAECEIATRRDETVKVIMPYVKIRFRPYMSAILPKGRRNIAEARRYEVVTQVNKIASIPNSLPMEGSAMLTEELIKGVRKELIVATTNAAVLLV